jgi:osmotically-inducible protein OsmY
MRFHAGAISTILTLAGLILSGCQNQSVGPVDDTAITKDVKARLAAEFGAIERREARQMERGADQQVVNYIDVSSSNGMVTLSGEVRGNRAKTKAEQIAKSVPHVSGVVNQLGVAPGYSDDAVGTGTR